MASFQKSDSLKCIDDPNFAIICSFFERFSPSCGITHPTFLELQQMLELKDDVPKELVDLHVKLLRKARKSVSIDKWERALIKLAYLYSPEDSWELEKNGYNKLNLNSRLRLLKVLQDAQFDWNIKFKNDVNKLSADDLRQLPLGRDIDGKTYWVQSDCSLDIRIYKEDLQDNTWNIVADNSDSLSHLIKRLTDEQDPEYRMILPDPVVPILDTGQENLKENKFELVAETTDEECNGFLDSPECEEKVVTTDDIFTSAVNSRSTNDSKSYLQNNSSTNEGSYKLFLSNTSDIVPTNVQENHKIIENTGKINALLRSESNTPSVNRNCGCIPMQNSNRSDEDIKDKSLKTEINLKFNKIKPVWETNMLKTRADNNFKTLSKCITQSPSKAKLLPIPLEVLNDTTVQSFQNFVKELNRTTQSAKSSSNLESILKSKLTQKLNVNSICDNNGDNISIKAKTECTENSDKSDITNYNLNHVVCSEKSENDVTKAIIKSPHVDQTANEVISSNKESDELRICQNLTDTTFEISCSVTDDNERAYSLHITENTKLPCKKITTDTTNEESKISVTDTHKQNKRLFSEADDYSSEDDSYKRLRIAETESEEEIEEPLMLIKGVGYGKDCDTGNTKNLVETEPNQSSNQNTRNEADLSNTEEPPTSELNIDLSSDSENRDKKKPKLWTIDAICGNDKAKSSNEDVEDNHYDNTRQFSSNNSAPIFDSDEGKYNSNDNSSSDTIVQDTISDDSASFSSKFNPNSYIFGNLNPFETTFFQTGNENIANTSYSEMSSNFPNASIFPENKPENNDICKNDYFSYYQSSSPKIIDDRSVPTSNVCTNFRSISSLTSNEIKSNADKSLVYRQWEDNPRILMNTSPINETYKTEIGKNKVHSDTDTSNMVDSKDMHTITSNMVDSKDIHTITSNMVDSKDIHTITSNMVDSKDMHTVTASPTNDVCKQYETETNINEETGSDKIDDNKCEHLLRNKMDTDKQTNVQNEKTSYFLKNKPEYADLKVNKMFLENEEYADRDNDYKQQHSKTLFLERVPENISISTTFPVDVENEIEDKSKVEGDDCSVEAVRMQNEKHNSINSYKSSISDESCSTLICYSNVSNISNTEETLKADVTVESDSFVECNNSYSDQSIFNSVQLDAKDGNHYSKIHHNFSNPDQLENAEIILGDNKFIDKDCSIDAADSILQKCSKPLVPCVDKEIQKVDDEYCSLNIQNISKSSMCNLESRIELHIEENYGKDSNLNDSEQKRNVTESDKLDLSSESHDDVEQAVQLTSHLPDELVKEQTCAIPSDLKIKPEGVDLNKHTANNLESTVKHSSLFVQPLKEIYDPNYKLNVSKSDSAILKSNVTENEPLPELESSSSATSKDGPLNVDDPSIIEIDTQPIAECSGIKEDTVLCSVVKGSISEQMTELNNANDTLQTISESFQLTVNRKALPDFDFNLKKYKIDVLNKTCKSDTVKLFVEPGNVDKDLFETNITAESIKYNDDSSTSDKSMEHKNVENTNLQHESNKQNDGFNLEEQSVCSNMNEEMDECKLKAVSQVPQSLAVDIDSKIKMGIKTSVIDYKIDDASDSNTNIQTHENAKSEFVNSTNEPSQNFVENKILVSNSPSETAKGILKYCNLKEPLIISESRICDTVKSSVNKLVKFDKISDVSVHDVQNSSIKIFNQSSIANEPTNTIDYSDSIISDSNNAHCSLDEDNRCRSIKKLQCQDNCIPDYSNKINKLSAKNFTPLQSTLNHPNVVNLELDNEKCALRSNIKDQNVASGTFKSEPFTDESSSIISQRSELSFKPLDMNLSQPILDSNISTDKIPSGIVNKSRMVPLHAKELSSKCTPKEEISESSEIHSEHPRKHNVEDMRTDAETKFKSFSDSPINLSMSANNSTKKSLNDDNKIELVKNFEPVNSVSKPVVTETNYTQYKAGSIATVFVHNNMEFENSSENLLKSNLFYNNSISETTSDLLRITDKSNNTQSDSNQDLNLKKLYPNRSTEEILEDYSIENVSYVKSVDASNEENNLKKWDPYSDMENCNKINICEFIPTDDKLVKPDNKNKSSLESVQMYETSFSVEKSAERCKIDTSDCQTEFSLLQNLLTADTKSLRVQYSNNSIAIGKESSNSVMTEPNADNKKDHTIQSSASEAVLISETIPINKTMIRASANEEEYTKDSTSSEIDRTAIISEDNEVLADKSLCSKKDKVSENKNDKSKCERYMKQNLSMVKQKALHLQRRIAKSTSIMKYKLKSRMLPTSVIKAMRKSFNKSIPKISSKTYKKNDSRKESATFEKSNFKMNKLKQVNFLRKGKSPKNMEQLKKENRLKKTIEREKSKEVQRSEPKGSKIKLVKGQKEKPKQCSVEINDDKESSVVESKDTKVSSNKKNQKIVKQTPQKNTKSSAKNVNNSDEDTTADNATDADDASVEENKKVTKKCNKRKGKGKAQKKNTKINDLEEKGTKMTTKNTKAQLRGNKTQSKDNTSQSKDQPKEHKIIIPRSRLLLGLDVDSVSFDSGRETRAIRQSRRLAQIKIREQVDSTSQKSKVTPVKIETKGNKKKAISSNASNKTGKRKKPDSDMEEYVEHVEKPENCKKKKKKEKPLKKLFNSKNPWKSSSGSSSEEVEEEEHYYEEEEEEEEDLEFDATSDHEFSPESDLDDEDYKPIRQARTAKIEPDDNSLNEVMPDLACKKCQTTDNPEWILLCDSCDAGWHAACLHPTLMSIPEGDWFCPPCQHNKLITSLRNILTMHNSDKIKKENEEMRRKRLAYVGIGLSNIIPTNSEKLAKRSEIQKPKIKTNPYDRFGTSEGTTSEYSDSDSSEPMYQLRMRKQATVSYRFNEYDEMINSAIQGEVEAKLTGSSMYNRSFGVTGDLKATSSAHGNSISQTSVPPNLPSMDEETKSRVSNNINTANEINSHDKISDEMDESKVRVTDESGTEKETSEAEEDDNKFIQIPSSLLRPVKKKPKKLTQLDLSSEEDHYSDEDFKGSSGIEEDDEEYAQGETDSDEIGYRKSKRKKAAPTRRSTRARTTRFDSDFVNDDSEEDSEPQRKKKSRKFWDETDSEEEEDSTWGKKKKNRYSSTWKSKSTKRKNFSFDDDSDDEVKVKKSKNKKPRVTYGLEDTDDEKLARRTRGRKINYQENLDTDSEQDSTGLKSKKISDEEYVQEDEEEEYDDLEKDDNYKDDISEVEKEENNTPKGPAICTNIEVSHDPKVVEPTQSTATIVDSDLGLNVTAGSIKTYSKKVPEVPITSVQITPRSQGDKIPESIVGGSEKNKKEKKPRRTRKKDVDMYSGIVKGENKILLKKLDSGLPIQSIKHQPEIPVSSVISPVQNYILSSVDKSPISSNVSVSICTASTPYVPLNSLTMSAANVMNLSVSNNSCKPAPVTHSFPSDTPLLSSSLSEESIDKDKGKSVPIRVVSPSKLMAMPEKTAIKPPFIIAQGHPQQSILPPNMDPQMSTSNILHNPRLPTMNTVPIMGSFAFQSIDQQKRKGGRGRGKKQAETKLHNQSQSPEKPEMIPLHMIKSLPPMTVKPVTSPVSSSNPMFSYSSNRMMPHPQFHGNQMVNAGVVGKRVKFTPTRMRLPLTPNTQINRPELSSIYKMTQAPYTVASSAYKMNQNISEAYKTALSTEPAIVNTTNIKTEVSDQTAMTTSIPSSTSKTAAQTTKTIIKEEENSNNECTTTIESPSSMANANSYASPISLTVERSQQSWIQDQDRNRMPDKKISPAKITPRMQQFYMQPRPGMPLQTYHPHMPQISSSVRSPSQSNSLQQVPNQTMPLPLNVQHHIVKQEGTSTNTISPSVHMIKQEVVTTSAVDDSGSKSHKPYSVSSPMIVSQQQHSQAHLHLKQMAMQRPSEHQANLSQQQSLNHQQLHPSQQQQPRRSPIRQPYHSMQQLQQPSQHQQHLHQTNQLQHAQTTQHQLHQSIQHPHHQPPQHQLQQSPQQSQMPHLQQMHHQSSQHQLQQPQQSPQQLPHQSHPSYQQQPHQSPRQQPHRSPQPHQSYQQQLQHSPQQQPQHSPQPQIHASNQQQQTPQSPQQQSPQQQPHKSHQPPPTPPPHHSSHLQPHPTHQQQLQQQKMDQLSQQQEQPASSFIKSEKPESPNSSVSSIVTPISKSGSNAQQSPSTVSISSSTSSSTSQLSQQVPTPQKSNQQSTDPSSSQPSLLPQCTVNTSVTSSSASVHVSTTSKISNLYTSTNEPSSLTIALQYSTDESAQTPIIPNTKPPTSYVSKSSVSTHAQNPPVTTLHSQVSRTSQPYPPAAHQPVIPYSDQIPAPPRTFYSQPPMAQTSAGYSKLHSHTSVSTTVTTLPSVYSSIPPPTSIRYPPQIVQPHPQIHNASFHYQGYIPSHVSPPSAPSVLPEYNNFSQAAQSEQSSYSDRNPSTEGDDTEETTGEFGGLVSYFSSQREDDLDT